MSFFTEHSPAAYQFEGAFDAGRFDRCYAYRGLWIGHNIYPLGMYQLADGGGDGCLADPVL